MKSMRMWAATAVAAILATGPALATTPDCSPEVASTFDLIQKVVFDNHGCSDVVCHGTAKSGGLDLRAGASYDALFEQPSESALGWKRLVPGQTDESLLFVNLAAKTLPTAWTAPLRSMPLDPVPALSEDQLEAVRLWIQYGAPRDGVVANTGELLDSCLPPPRPIEIEPLDPPPAGEGVQLRMPRWILEPHSEHEVCFASYFDFTDQVPAEMRDATGTKMRVKRSQIRQDPLSHHLFGSMYGGNTSPNDPIWGPFRCRGGEKDGQSCDPTAFGFCGAEYFCGADPVNSIGCIGYGPGDASFGFNTFGITGSQETAVENRYVDGVYAELPLKGMVLWSSHAFNLTDTPGKLEAWMNLIFAGPGEQQSPVRNIFDASAIFKMEVPAFQTQEVCNHFRFPANSRIFALTSHVHKRGKRFRVFEGEFKCVGGARNGAPCSPMGVDFASPDICGGATCESQREIHVGDCNFDNAVSITELVQGVNIALGASSPTECTRLEINGDDRVSVDELVKAVNTALTNEAQMVERDPEASLLYLNLVYNDPANVRFDPPMQIPGSGGLRDEQTFTYCGLYDNGFTDPGEVKTQSGSPETPVGNFPGIGGPCVRTTHCTAGKVGAPCLGSDTVARNASCDSVTDMGDGMCDACPLKGGVTTEDEMFLLLGAYYVP